MPQLGLQQISLTLQVLGPQGMLTGTLGAPHSGLQTPPGGVQMPQTSLQQISPSGHVRHPQRTGCATRACGSTSGPASSGGGEAGASFAAASMTGSNVVGSASGGSGGPPACALDGG